VENRTSNTSKNKGAVVWLTGLSGAGKTTIANALCERLKVSLANCKQLDGDILRNGINAGLGFSDEDRLENIRRAAEIAKLFVESDFITICSFITPKENMRELAKKIIGEENFIEVYVNCSFEECEKRDVKGLYYKARGGNVANFTGMTSSFDPPANPDIVIDTEHKSIEACTTIVYTKLIEVLNTKKAIDENTASKNSLEVSR
jgi:adenylylsulfate kinase